MGMRTFLGALSAAVLATLAAGCFGVAGPAGSSTHAASPPPAPPATRVVVRTTVGRPARTREAVTARCPALARCRLVRDRASRMWALEASRTLTCNPARGGYRRAAAACRALLDLATREAHRGPQFCMCPIQVVPTPTAVGWVDRRRVRFDLGPCAMCGMPRQAQADARILLAA